MKKIMLSVLGLTVACLLLSGCGAPTAKRVNSSDSSSSSKVESSESVDKIETTESSKREVNFSSKFELMVEAAQSQIPAMMEQFEGMYSDITIESGKDNTIIYTYTSANEVGIAMDGDALKPVLAKELKPMFDGLGKMLPDLKAQYIFLDTDGTELLNTTITKEDVEQAE